MKKLLYITLCWLLATSVGWTQNQVTRRLKHVAVDIELLSKHRIRVKAITNISKENLDVVLLNGGRLMGTRNNLLPNDREEMSIQCDQINVLLKSATDGGSSIEWTAKDAEKEWNETHPTVAVSEEAQNNKEKTTAIPDVSKQKVSATEVSLPERKTRESSERLEPGKVVMQFKISLETGTFLSEKSIMEARSKVEEDLKALRHWANKDSCIADLKLNEYVQAISDSLTRYKDNQQQFLATFSKSYKRMDADVTTEIARIYEDRLKQREQILKQLTDEMETEEALSSTFDWSRFDGKVAMNLAAVVVLLVLLVFWFATAVKKRRKKKTIASLPAQGNMDSAGSSPSIVVRKTTTTVLKKQSLENATDSPLYLKIEGTDFCSDSKVRTIYFKNSCIKDIYNMYAEDLRNPANPKEDGCMVLGRWIQHAGTEEYDVSLEYIVRPGSDAVFEEYELNFGGKIKLKMAEQLRKLRKETNLQYDLTCWVHSHPGLGVFFSNSDNNVQMQLKHPSHPHFLIAIVVDILTPEQELGIFTFKHDATVNSKADLKKLYSLETLYKWAIESEQQAFNPEEHYNVLAKARSHYNECYGVELSNSAIIDMSMLVAGQGVNTVHAVHGFGCHQDKKTLFAVSKVSQAEAVSDNDLIGCFVAVAHCSLPSVRKAVAGYLHKIKFVLVYSSADGMLTTLPVNDNMLCMQTDYYGEENFEELKIWTRRKR